MVSPRHSQVREEISSFHLVVGLLQGLLLVRSAINTFPKRSSGGILCRCLNGEQMPQCHTKRVDSTRGRGSSTKAVLKHGWSLIYVYYRCMEKDAHRLLTIYLVPPTVIENMISLVRQDHFYYFKRHSNVFKECSVSRIISWFYIFTKNILPSSSLSRKQIHAGSSATDGGATQCSAEHIGTEGPWNQ